MIAIRIGAGQMGDTEDQLDIIAEYERRISYAFERIGQGVDLLLARAAAEAARQDAQPLTEVAHPQDSAPEPEPAVDPAVDPEEVARLREALDGERAANTQLSERVRAIREKQETTLAAMEKRLAQANRTVEAAQTDLNRLKRANLDLAEANRALIEAAGDPPAHLVNAALQAELETLRAVRAVEAGELSAILGGLEPLIAAHAKQGGSRAAHPGEGDDA